MLNDRTTPRPSIPIHLESFCAGGAAFLKQTQLSFLNNKLRSATIQANYNVSAYMDVRFIKSFPSREVKGNLTTKLAQVV